jgi:hypothetical protein
VGDAPAGNAGAVGGLKQTAMNLGPTFGIAVASSLVGSIGGAGGTGGAAGPVGAGAAGAGAAVVVLTAITVVAVIPAALLPTGGSR